MARKKKRWTLQKKRGKRNVIKTVPARVFDEVVGEAIFYDDNTIDMIQFSDISDEAKTIMAGFQEQMKESYGDAVSGQVRDRDPEA